ncbi:hypothetical protein Hanom_Chr15g01394781 [Helianthus anomalus]
MSKMDPEPVPNRYRYRIYRTGYLFGTDSVPTFDIFGTGSVPVFCSFLPSNTGTEPVPVPKRTEPGIFGTGTGTHF